MISPHWSDLLRRGCSLSWQCRARVGRRTACDQHRKVLWLSRFYSSDFKFANKTFNEMIFCKTEIGVVSSVITRVSLTRVRYNAIDAQLKAVCVGRIFPLRVGCYVISATSVEIRRHKRRHKPSYFFTPFSMK